MKQLEVQIMGQSYLLGCPDGGEAQLRDAVERVDLAMCKIRDANKVKARDRIAVLAALNLAFDLGQQAAAPLEAAGTPSAAVAAPSPAEPALAPTPESERAAQLIERLDHALAGDEHLL